MSNYPDWVNYMPLHRDWNIVKNNAQSRLCSIKAIAIHYTQAPGQRARETRAYFQSFVKASPNDVYDLDDVEQGVPLVGAHFIIDDSEILALAPSLNYTFFHVGDNRSNAGNLNCWNLTHRDTFVRGANFYTIGIEHCHLGTSGKFTPDVLQNSHKLVRWLMQQYNNSLLIGRHYDFSGKACPIYFAPVLAGRNDTFGKYGQYRHIPEFDDAVTEVRRKSFRWTKLLEYYKQSNSAAIPTELL